MLDERGRMVAPREPATSTSPAFLLVRSGDACAWALRCDVPAAVADEVEDLVRTEPTSVRDEPIHAQRYVQLLGSRVEFGPAYHFPDDIEAAPGVNEVTNADALVGSFDDLVPEYDGRSPMFVALEDGRPASVCFCARRSGDAAEAGLYTLEPFRGRGHGPRVTAAWARAIRSSGRVPLYSTSWTNEASRAVAAKLGLVMYASDWSVY